MLSLGCACPGGLFLSGVLLCSGAVHAAVARETLLVPVAIACESPCGGGGLLSCYCIEERLFLLQGQILVLPEEVRQCLEAAVTCQLGLILNPLKRLCGGVG